MNKIKLSTLIFLLMVFSNCHYDKEELSQSNNTEKVLRKVVLKEVIDTVCAGQELIKSRSTTHLVFDFYNDFNKKDSIDFFINEKVKSSVDINEYAKRIILDFTPKTYSKKDYPYLINIKKDSLNLPSLRIDFFKRKISLKFVLKYYSPFVYIKNENDSCFNITYSYCISNQDE